MDRRLFLLASVALVASPAVGAAAPRTYILIISARDCPWCVDWNAYDRPIFERLTRSKGAPVREVEVMSYGDIRQADAWPEDLKPILAQIRQRDGTPRFIVVRDGRIVQHAVGRRQYQLGILPLLA